jgi:ferredoxin
VITTEEDMTYVITESCQGTCDTACVDVCPVDCIAGPVAIDQIRSVANGDRAARLPALQLYIDPSECIDCRCCVPACPADAIFADDEVPPASLAAIAANAAFFSR